MASTLLLEVYLVMPPKISQEISSDKSLFSELYVSHACQYRHPDGDLSGGRLDIQPAQLHHILADFYQKLIKALPTQLFRRDTTLVSPVVPTYMTLVSPIEPILWKEKKLG